MVDTFAPFNLLPHFLRAHRGYAIFVGLTLSTSLLISCGGGGGGNPQAPAPQQSFVLRGVATLGPLRNANVVVYELDADGSRGAALGQAQTASDHSGSFSITLSRPPGGAVQIEASSGSYVSESHGGDVTRPSEAVIRAIVPAPVAGIPVAVNPLTDLAAERAGVLRRSGKTATLKEVHDTAQGELRASFGLQADLVTLIPSFNFRNTEATQRDAIALALVLTVFEHLAQTASVSHPEAIYTALRTDFRDGVLDFDSGVSAYGSMNLAVRQGSGRTRAELFKDYLASLLNITVNASLNGVLPSGLAAFLEDPANGGNRNVPRAPNYGCSSDTELAYLGGDRSQSLVCWDGTRKADGSPLIGTYYQCNEAGGPVLTTADPGRCRDGVTLPMLKHSYTLARYTAPEVKPFTAAERAAMLAATMNASLPPFAQYPIDIANAGQTLNAAQIEAYAQLNSQLMNFYGR